VVEGEELLLGLPGLLGICRPGAFSPKVSPLACQWTCQMAGWMPSAPPAPAHIEHTKGYRSTRLRCCQHLLTPSCTRVLSPTCNFLLQANPCTVLCPNHRSLRGATDKLDRAKHISTLPIASRLNNSSPRCIVPSQQSAFNQFGERKRKKQSLHQQRPTSP
jgi:hypothetical protein